MRQVLPVSPVFPISLIGTWTEWTYGGRLPRTLAVRPSPSTSSRRRSVTGHRGSLYTSPWWDVVYGAWWESIHGSMVRCRLRGVVGVYTRVHGEMSFTGHRGSLFTSPWWGHLRRVVGVYTRVHGDMSCPGRRGSLYRSPWWDVVYGTWWESIHESMVRCRFHIHFHIVCKVQN